MGLYVQCLLFPTMFYNLAPSGGGGGGGGGGEGDRGGGGVGIQSSVIWSSYRVSERPEYFVFSSVQLGF